MTNSITPSSSTSYVPETFEERRARRIAFFTQFDPVTPSQRGFLNDLGRQLDGTEGLGDKFTGNRSDASNLIGSLLSQIEKMRKAAKDVSEVEPGFYTDGEDIVQVVRAKSSGRNYAKKIVAKKDGGVTAIYVPNLYARRAQFVALTEEVAANFGKKFGSCCFCQRTLSNPESVELGMGPVCRSRHLF